VKKLINDPFEVVDEMFEGFISANAQIIKAVGTVAVCCDRTKGIIIKRNIHECCTNERQ